MTDPYAWRAPQPDEPSVLLPDGRTLDPLNLGAVLPRDPVNPLARLIVSRRPTAKLVLPDGTETDLEVEEKPLSRAALDYIQKAKADWARRQLNARGLRV